MSTKFRGVVGGVTYTDPALFEQAARGLGYHRNGRRTSWRLGTPVRITLEDGTKVDGQVWAKAAGRGYVWVALDNGRYVAVHQQSGIAYERPASGERVGRVAA
jgi:hypothetical protein